MADFFEYRCTRCGTVGSDPLTWGKRTTCPDCGAPVEERPLGAEDDGASDTDQRGRRRTAAVRVRGEW